MPRWPGDGSQSLAVRTSGPDTTRFAWLLAALVALLALPSALAAFRIGGPGMRIGFSAVLVASLFAVSRRRVTLWIGFALAVPAVALDGISVATSSRTLAILSSLISIVFIGVVVVAMGTVLLRARHVTADTILGGICGYMLLGILWTSIYTLIEIAGPGSVLLDGSPLPHWNERPEPFRYVELIYFSFVTLTTVGYGDMMPATEGTRALAAGEAIAGQLYLAIFVARLGGLHLSQAHRD